jgi:hypothetical protein
MAVDHIRYDILAQEALRGVVRAVLVDAAKNGLPGDHHFYISFDTRADGVRLSPRMLAQYPKEMTLVLQHQFWDLAVTDDGFEVGVSFSGIPERLAIPFAAIKGFFDPSVQFGLQFEEIGEASVEPQESETDGGKTPDKDGNLKPAGNIRVAARPPAEHKGARPAGPKVPTPANPEPSVSEATNSESANSGASNPGAPNPGATKTSPDEKADKPEGGEVVRLDRFRKK